MGTADSPQSDDDDDHRQFVDPTPFLNIVQPILEWNMECQEYTTKVMNLVTDMASLTEGFEEIITDVLSQLAPFESKYAKDILSELMDIPLSETLLSIANTISESIDQVPSDLKHLFMFGE